MPRATTPDDRGLLDGLDGARRRGVARCAQWALADGLLGLWGLASLAVGLALATDRGDLARTILAWGAVAFALGLAIRTHRRARRAFGPPGPAGLVATARTLAEAHRRPRGPSAPIPPELAEEILAAAELALDPPEGARALARAYAARIARRLARLGVRPVDLLPRPSPLPRLRAAGILVALWAVGATVPAAEQAFWATVHGIDGRPPPPPEPLWTRLEVDLAYPEHTGRAPRTLPNPTGAVRAPAGTRVTVRIAPRVRPAAGTLVVAFEHPEGVSADTTGTADFIEADDGTWSATFELRASASADVVLFDDDGDPIGRAAPLAFAEDPDRPPEVAFADEGTVEDPVARDEDTVEVAFRARDDYGIASAALVYELADGTPHRIPIPLPDAPRRRLSHVHRWDLSAIPVRERTEVTYYVEVRDNDPGLGLVPLDDPPGKTARTPRRKLVVEDDDAEHARNVASLAKIRDAAVDLLAERMILAADGPGLEPAAAFARLRTAFLREETLLADLAALLDAYATDALAAERRAKELAGIHARLREHHAREARRQETVPAEPPWPPELLARVVPPLLAHDRTMVGALEDEVIRLDDLLDGEILERIETLLARLRATQQKIVELLEQLAAGDESVRPVLEGLLERRREDLARLSEARAMLGREIDDEFLNPDALELLRKLGEETVAGGPEAELERARRQLEELSGMHEAVQDRLGRGAEGAEALSEEDRARMELLRALSRIEDRAKADATELKDVRRAYRRAATMPPLSGEQKKALRSAAKAIRRRLDGVDDTELGRKGRAALLDAEEIASRLADLADRDGTTVAEAYDAARALHEALGRARLAAEGGSEPAERLDAARKRSGRLVSRLEEALPRPEDVLDGADRARLPQVAGDLRGLRAEIRGLLRSRTSDPLPEDGRRALDRALESLEGAARAAGGARLDEGIARTERAAGQVRRAIDSLRRRGSPPPAAPRGRASTAAERDRSLRDVVMEALRGHERERLGPAVERYYEELLR